MLVYAQEEARLLNHNFIGTEHILLGLLRENEGLAARVLESLNISLDTVREKVAETIGPAEVGYNGSPPFTPRAKKVLELALREALQLGHNYIGTEHILLGLVREGQGVAATVLVGLGADLPLVRAQVISHLGGSASADSPTGRSVVPKSAWSQHPTKIIGGPDERLSSGEIEFTITGVLLFDGAIHVYWTLTGVPESIADTMESKGFSVVDQEPDSIASVSIVDDAGTVYTLSFASIAARLADAFAGRSGFTPAPSEGATQLDVRWQDRSIRVSL